jgi:hypothetical protein
LADAFQDLDVAAENVSGVMAAIGAAVPLMNRLNHDALPAEFEDVVTPPRRRLSYRSAAGSAGYNQFI